MKHTSTRALCAVILALTLSAPIVARAQSSEAHQTWQRLVGLLQYLAADYPAAVDSKSEFELAEQRSFLGEAKEAATELGPQGAPFVARIAALEPRIAKGEDPAGVSQECSALVNDIIQVSGLRRSPQHVPDAKLGQQLFETSCTACHGADGRGQVPIAATMEPKPADLTEGDTRTPYRVFNTVGLGVSGTAMPAFPTLSDEERWAVSFYVLTLNKPACDHPAPKVSLEKLATSSDAELARDYGASELACLRRNPTEPDFDQALLLAKNKVHQAIRLAKDGNGVAARKTLVDGYLLGIEPAEPLLRARAPDLVLQIEQGFMSTRLAAERDLGRVEAEGSSLIKLLDAAEKKAGARTDFWSVFWVAIFILLREGFEASIVIGALLAVLKKMDAREHTRVVHAGWISALFAGAIAFVFGQKLLAGANREWVEGLTALFAVGMLLYAALWLNARSNIRKFMGELRERMQGAIGRESLLGLFVISFSAMFRESFETAIFLQGLAIDSASGVAWGAVAGLVVLVGFVVFVGRFGYRLPMKTLFTASTVLLVATAVMLLGKGLHSLQEVAALPLLPFASFSVPTLGLYADAVSFVPQVVLAAAPLLWLLRRKTGTAVTRSEQMATK